MEQDILKKLEEQDKKLEDIYRSVEKTRKYFLWTLLITLIFMVLPSIGLAYAIPKLMNTYSGILGL